jgi:hypothetical protein
MTLYLSKALTDAMTIEQVVSLVNDGLCEGMEGIEFTPEMLAGQYAAKEAEWSTSEAVTEADLEAQLEYLRAAGAKFDTQGAVAHGMKIHSCKQNSL